MQELIVVKYSRAQKHSFSSLAPAQPQIRRQVILCSEDQLPQALKKLGSSNLLAIQLYAVTEGNELFLKHENIMGSVGKDSQLTKETIEAWYHSKKKQEKLPSIFREKTNRPEAPQCIKITEASRNEQVGNTAGELPRI